MSCNPGISVVIPALNEERCIESAIRSAARHRDVEVIVSDGGSTDATAALARAAGARLTCAPAGRGTQLNAGAALATAPIVLFLHADTRLPDDFPHHVRRTLALPRTAAGAFTLRIEPTSAAMQIVQATSNWRSRHWQLPYGDQGIFLPTELFRRLGGFSNLPVMEDLELVRRLRRVGNVRLCPAIIRTSARRWQQHGALRTTLLNQLLIAAYFAGVSAERIHAWREGHRRALQAGEPRPCWLP